MAESDAEHALQYRNRAEQIRITARRVANLTTRDTLLKIAAEFDALADGIERAIKPR